MLRTNLSTKPFYNERAIHSVLAFIAIVVIALTVFNVAQIVLLSRRQSDLSRRAAEGENRARELRSHAASVRQSVDPKQLDAISGAAREANVLIGQRLFSWTDLLNRLETTLPEEVRITAMRPRVEKDGSVTVVMAVVGRRVEDIDRFMANLETNGAFADVYAREEAASEEGLRLATIEGRYLSK
jgi:Tfp pilus assembly protein PilN